MRQFCGVTVRGVEHTVGYLDKGYEPDTGAQEIEWEFFDDDAPDDLTDDEYEAVTEQVYKAANDPTVHRGWDDDVI